MNIDIIKGHIVSSNEEVSPAWTVQLSNAFNSDTSCIVCQEQNWTVKGVIGVEDLASRKCIIPMRRVSKTNTSSPPSLSFLPCLSISIHDTLSKDLEVLASPSPESD